jgi:hypothetical protein
MRRFIGLLFLALALAVIAWEALGYFKYGDWSLIVFGEIAFRLFPESLNTLQAVIQRYVTAWLWDPAIQTFLLWPAWPFLTGLGLLLMLPGRRRQ